MKKKKNKKKSKCQYNMISTYFLATYNSFPLYVFKKNISCTRQRRIIRSIENIFSLLWRKGKMFGNVDPKNYFM